MIQGEERGAIFAGVIERIENLTITGSTTFGAGGIQVVQYYSPKEPATEFSSRLSLVNVDLTGNGSGYAGAVDIISNLDAEFELSIVDSAVHGNASTHSGGGGVSMGGRFTLTSQNTDWGAGEDDNSPHDLALQVDGDSHSHDFDGVVDFTCSTANPSCE